MAFKFPQLKTVIAAVVATFFLVQIVSLLINSVWPSVGIMKGGPAILLMLLCVAIISLFVLSLNLEELKRKENLVFIIIVFGLVALAFWKLNDFFPQLFSISPEFSETIKQTVGSILGVGG